MDPAPCTTGVPRAWKREVDVDEMEQNGKKKKRPRNVLIHSEDL